MVDLLYMKDKSVKVVALLQRIVQKGAGSCVRRTVEASSGSCNQATEPNFNESLLRVSKCLKSVRFGKNTQYVTQKTHIGRGDTGNTSVYEVSAPMTIFSKALALAAGYLIEQRTLFVIH